MERKVCKDRFSDKVAIVTGGSTGIGFAIALELCREGASVAFTGRSDMGFATEESLKKAGYNAMFIQGDMSDENFCKKTVQETLNKWNKVNYLVNNAFSFIAKAMDAQAEDWQKSYFAGPVAYARMIQNVVDPMRNQGGGAVVNIASVSAHIAQVSRWTYNAAKGAVKQLTRCQALDLASENIRVNSVSPAWIWTRELEKAAQLDGGGREKWEPIWGQFHMLERCAEPIECAGPALFLLSDDASFITGTDLLIDGGYLAMGPEGLGRQSSFAGSD
ncbi:MAG: SDR family oxidoreductase [Desulfotignum sp.]|nr:SDR family oxidoreductase [Desulfotignum sp.]MCF8138873.1 SDR family oxidoreductase [Desulfotignum sp.]